jgi:hypothetical protein
MRVDNMWKRSTTALYVQEAVLIVESHEPHCIREAGSERGGKLQGVFELSSTVISVSHSHFGLMN